MGLVEAEGLRLPSHRSMPLKVIDFAIDSNEVHASELRYARCTEPNAINNEPSCNARRSGVEASLSVICYCDLTKRESEKRVRREM